MFLRRKKHLILSDEVIANEIQKTEVQKENSRKELLLARNTVSILNEIRRTNHIVMDLREVFGGR